MTITDWSEITIPLTIAVIALFRTLKYLKDNGYIPKISTVGENGNGRPKKIADLPIEALDAKLNEMATKQRHDTRDIINGFAGKISDQTEKLEDKLDKINDSLIKIQTILERSR